MIATSVGVPGMDWNVVADALRTVPLESNVAARIGAFLEPKHTDHDYDYASRPVLTTHNASLSSLYDAHENHLLAAVPQADWARWKAHLEPCDMPLGKVLFEPGCLCTHAYFPATSIVSMLYLTEDGESVETAVVGYEGIVGLPLLMSGSAAPGRAIVRSAGHGFSMKASWLMEEFDRSRPIQQLLLRYLQAYITQTAQTAVCNRHHSLEQQLCRWLLMSLDRLSSDEIVATQELIANSLGVRREGVTAAAGHLQDAGLISYRRGHILVIDREGLERPACECYGVVKHHYDEFMPEPLAA